MKSIIPLVFLFLLSSFMSKTEEGLIQNQKEDFSWLLGAWIRTNEKEGQQTFEHWKRKGKNELVGLGFTLKGGDTIWKEDILLRKKGKWQFEVSGQGETTPTIFIVTEADDTSFTCQNPQNEFPKVIGYEKSETGLKAVISGGGPTITFEFERIN